MISTAGPIWAGLLISEFVSGQPTPVDVNLYLCSNDKANESALATAFDLTCRAWQVITVSLRSTVT
jgi:hypothetical protein